MRALIYIILGIFFFIYINCGKKQTIPQNLIDLNQIIPTLKDSAYYYAYYKDWFSNHDTNDKSRIEYLKKIFDKSKFIFFKNNKYLVIATPMPEDAIICVFGEEKGIVKKVFKIFPHEFSEKYGFDWNIYNQYIIVHTGVYNGNNFGPGFMFDSYDYIYGFKKDSLVVLDSIISRHRENKLVDIGQKTIIASSKATIINWKFISKGCILKEIQSGEVVPLIKIDSIVFKSNSNKSKETKCFN